MTTTNRHHVTPDRLENARQHWQEVASQLEQQIDTLQQRLVEAQGNVESLDRATALCDALIPALPKTYGIHSHIAPRELLSCDSIRNMGRRVAELTGGKLKLSDAARLIFSTGASDSDDFSGVKSNLYGMVSVSNEWKKDNYDVYHWITFRPEADLRAELPEDDQWPEESSVTDSGDASPPTFQDNEGPEVVLGRIIA